MVLGRIAGYLAVFTSVAFAATVNVPGNVLSIGGTNPTGGSFTFSGTLTQNDTIAFTLSGAACLQSGSTYCTNGAGVVTVAGSTAVGGTSTFTSAVGGFTKTYNFGSIVMVISGVGAVQIFPANATNGLGSGSPPANLTLPATSLAALGFGTFTAANPTISFIVADTNFGDNSGTVTLTQGASVPLTPAPGTLVLLFTGLAIAGLRGLMRKRRTAAA